MFLSLLRLLSGATIKAAKNLVFHAHTNHIEVLYHYIREQRTYSFKQSYCPTKDNVSKATPHSLLLDHLSAPDVIWTLRCFALRRLLIEDTFFEREREMDTCVTHNYYYYFLLTGGRRLAENNC